MTASAANREPLLQNAERMRYRPLGKTGLLVSALSLGCMRLSDNAEQNELLIQRALDLGVNYFETTRYYLGGTCQHRTAAGLNGRTRGIIVSGKDGVGPDTTAAQFRREIERQLYILGLTHFKFYQVGWLKWENIKHLLKPGGAWDALRRAKDEGLVQHVGFTGHDTVENVIKCLETGLFDSCTLTYNIFNRTYEQAIARAAELGVGVVAMCPVAGGTLVADSPALREAFGMDLPTPALALRFALSNPAVSTACSGMTTAAMLEENAATVYAFDPTAPAADFSAQAERLANLYRRLGGFCTQCGYCRECPQGVDIPRLMAIDTSWRAANLESWAKAQLQGVVKERDPQRCDRCGACEKKCPNRLPIREAMGRLAALAGDRGS